MNTPENITSLEPNEYIVVGTNHAGNHTGGLARYAKEHFRLQDYCSEGLSGQCYCINTMSGLPTIAVQAGYFIEFAEFNPDKTFYLTKIGTGIANHTEAEVAPLFKNCPDNVIKPRNW